MNGSFLSAVIAADSPPAPRGAGSFHQVSMIYIFIDTNVCFLSACAFKCPATPGHASWVKGHRGWGPLQAETLGLIFTKSLTQEREELTLKNTDCDKKHVVLNTHPSPFHFGVLVSHENTFSHEKKDPFPAFKALQFPQHASLFITKYLYSLFVLPVFTCWQERTCFPKFSEVYERQVNCCGYIPKHLFTDTHT